MPRTFQINVQVDVLPDVPGQAGTLYFGVRLSAYIVPDIVSNPPDRAVTADEPLLLPWQWTGADPSKPASWNPADAGSWMAYWVDPANPTVTTDAKIAVVPLVNGDAK